MFDVMVARGFTERDISLLGVGVGEGREIFVFEYICLPHHDARVVVVILFD